MLSTLFGFKGRLSRIGYIESLLSIVLLDVAVFLAGKYVGDYGVPGLSTGLSGAIAAWLPRVFGLLTVWSVLAVSVKRCHDRGRSGWLLLLAVIPVIGWLWLLVDLFILGGTEGRNSHGMQPFAHSWDEWQGEADHAAPAATAAAGGHDDHDSHGGPGLDWTGQGSTDHHHNGPDPAQALGAYSPPAHVPDGHGHDDHSSNGHGHDDHALAAPDDHGHDAHDDHGHDDHGHDDHGHDDHGHDDHRHAPAHA